MARPDGVPALVLRRHECTVIGVENARMAGRCPVQVEHERGRRHGGMDGVSSGSTFGWATPVVSFHSPGLVVVRPHPLAAAHAAHYGFDGSTMIRPRPRPTRYPPRGITSLPCWTRGQRASTIISALLSVFVPRRLRRQPLGERPLADLAADGFAERGELAELPFRQGTLVDPVRRRPCHGFTRRWMYLDSRSTIAAWGAGTAGSIGVRDGRGGRRFPGAMVSMSIRPDIEGDARGPAAMGNGTRPALRRRREARRVAHGSARWHVGGIIETSSLLPLGGIRVC